MACHDINHFFLHYCSQWQSPNTNKLLVKVPYLPGIAPTICTTPCISWCNTLLKWSVWEGVIVIGGLICTQYKIFELLSLFSTTMPTGWQQFWCWVKNSIIWLQLKLTAFLKTATRHVWQCKSSREVESNKAVNVKSSRAEYSNCAVGMHFSNLFMHSVSHATKSWKMH